MRGHLSGDGAYQAGLVRFIENHDEPRAAATFPGDKARAAAVAALTQTGARIVHEGQIEGRAVRLPVFLGRRPEETADAALVAFYEGAAGARSVTARSGTAAGSSPRPAAGPGTTPGGTWSPGAGTAQERRLVVVNLGDAPASGHVSLAVGGAPRAPMAAATTSPPARATSASGDDLHDGLYVALGAWGWHFFTLTPLAPRED